VDGVEAARVAEEVGVEVALARDLNAEPLPVALAGELEQRPELGREAGGAVERASGRAAVADRDDRNDVLRCSGGPA